jgi:hypothetical protein
MNVKKIFGFVAIAGLLFVAAPTQQANAVSLSGPGIASSVQGSSSEALTTQVQYRRDHGWQRPHIVRRHHGWNRPHHYQRRHWR